MDLFKNPEIKKRILIAAILIILIVVLGFATKSLWFPKVSCIFPNYELAGTPVNKSYPDKYLSLGEWQNYEDPEVRFFLAPETQKIFFSKINELKGYGDFSYASSYAVVQNLISIDKGYYGDRCQPLRYNYDLMVFVSLQGRDLPSSPFGSWYYKDKYEIKAIYRPDAKKWEKFEIQSLERKLISQNVLDETLENAKQSSQLQDIIKNGYQVSELYWSLKGQSGELKNDTVTLVYSKPFKDGENLTDYFIIELDNFNKTIASQKIEKK